MAETLNLVVFLNSLMFLMLDHIDLQKCSLFEGKLSWISLQTYSQSVRIKIHSLMFDTDLH